MTSTKAPRTAKKAPPTRMPPVTLAGLGEDEDVESGSGPAPFGGFDFLDAAAPDSASVPVAPAVPAQQHAEPATAATANDDDAATGAHEANESIAADPRESALAAGQAQVYVPVALSTGVDGGPRQQQVDDGSGSAAAVTESAPQFGSHGQVETGPSVAGSAGVQVSRGSSEPSAAVVRRETGLGLPARRPARRSPAQQFTPGGAATPRPDPMEELGKTAPRYAGLLTSYNNTHKGTVLHKSRNVHLYGRVTEEVADQITLDKATFGRMTQHFPRLLQGHYVDAALDLQLRGLNPRGTDVDALEAEKEIVWNLAMLGLEYREFIRSDPDNLAIPESRPSCRLNADVDARMTRMMDLLQGLKSQIKVRPFEIVSACLAQYLQGLPSEQEALSAFFQRHITTSEH